MALGYLVSWFPGETEHFAPFFQRLEPAETATVATQVQRRLNAPLTSSCGRLFDAVAALIGLCSVAHYEGQAAMELQAIADPAAEGAYPYDIYQSRDRWIVDPSPLLWSLFEDFRKAEPPPTISMRFHRTLAMLTVDVCRRLASESGLSSVALSGGVFQNHLLLGEVVSRLERAGLHSVFHRRVPTNDGGLSFGQAIVAHAVKGGEPDG
jgi:hydrogenase maturation protein HypF